MHPLIKEALSAPITKDAESKKIYKFIADFIKDYGYLLTEGNLIKFDIYCPNDKLSISPPYSHAIKREIETTYDKDVILKILQNEGAEFEQYPYPYVRHYLVTFTKQ